MINQMFVYFLFVYYITQHCICLKRCFSQTSLLVEVAMQEPVTVKVMGEEEPSTKQDRFSYLVSLRSSTGANVT